MKSPVFIHSQFRTASSWLWSQFRKNSDFINYYEPFHECLFSLSEDEALLISKFSDNLRHPKQEKHYFYEYPLKNSGGVENYKPSFAFNDFIRLKNENRNKDIENYIYSLISEAGENRACFHFCRTSLRSSWLENHIKGIHFYLLRDPIFQFNSFKSFNDNYFLGSLLLTLNINSNNPLLLPLNKIIHLPEDVPANLYDQIFYWRENSSFYSLDELYMIHYYFWLLSLLQNLSNPNIRVIDIDLLSTSDQAFNELNFDLNKIIDIKIERPKVPLSELSSQIIDRFSVIEKIVNGMLIDALPEELCIEEHLIGESRITALNQTRLTSFFSRDIASIHNMKLDPDDFRRMKNIENSYASRKKISILESQLKESNSLNTSLQKELKQVSSEKDAILSSKSWRLTKPLRLIKDIMK